MMAKLLTLESFDEMSEHEKDELESLNEEEWLKVFEKGYKDGWEDALRSHGTKQEEIKAELAASLESISFTMVEARAKVLKDIEPLIGAVLDTVLKPSLNALLIDQINSQISGIAGNLSQVSVEIMVAPENVGLLQSVTATQAHLPVKFAADPNLGDGQAFLRMGEDEQKIDLPGALHAIRQILEDFFETTEPQKEYANG